MSQKTAEASEEAKITREMKEEAIKDRISTVRGNVVAFQENARLAGEEKDRKFRSAILKAQMTVEEKIKEYKEKTDKKMYEAYVDAQINYIIESYETASYLISNAQLAILETAEVISEFEEKYGASDEETSAEA